MKIGFIGLGNVGFKLANSVLESGFELFINDLDKDAGNELIKTTIRAASGRLTCAEVLGHKEFIMTKLFRSA